MSQPAGADPRAPRDPVATEPAAADATLRVPRPRRWDVPFGEMGEGDLDRLLGLEPFCSMDPTRFSPAVPLRGVLANDTRLVRFGRGDIVVREGDYGASAFLIVSGAVRVLAGLPAAMLGRLESRRRGWLSLLAQPWTNARAPEVRDLARAAHDARVAERRAAAGETRIFLQDVPGVLDRHGSVRLGAGETFGELAALGRTPRTASVFAEEESELLEVRWQGLRELRARDPALKEFIDRRYRERSLATHLRETPLFRHLDPRALEALAQETVFESYGRFDWHGSYRALAGEVEVRLADEPVIAEEGHYPNGLILIRSGFARLTRRHGHGQLSLSYIGKGAHYGLEELVANWRSRQQVPLGRTLRAVGYVDVLRVPTAAVERHVLPALPPEPAPAAPGPGGAGPSDARLPQPLIEFLVDRRFINGTAAMVIDLDRCTRCDDCVRACAVAHDGNPRFLRHGPRQGSLMVANACMHCADPVCMIGCPTGAIHRDPARGQVVINDATCIGCATCARSCPYDNIQMVEIHDRRGRSLLDEATGAPILKAAKCDLCIDQLGGPACQRACPHDALVRIDLTRPDPLGEWLER